VLGHDAEFLLVAEDGVADFVPTAVEEMHVADLLDPLRRRMVRRVCAARHVINEERLVGRDLLELFHVLDGIVSHRRGQIPTGLPLKRIDGRRVAEQVRLPLAGVAADEPVEILEAHPGRPLLKRPRLARLIERRVVILAEPRGRVPILLEYLTNRSAISLDDGVVTRESRRSFANYAKAGYVMIAASNQRRARRRAKRRGMKLRIAKTRFRDAIQCRRRNNAAKGARRAKSAIVSHDEQNVGRALGRDDARRPPRFRLGGFLLDHTAEFRIRWRELFAVNGSGCAG